jgi:hypothetical protein
MCSPFGFSIQQFFICLSNCQKIAFVCEVPQSICTPNNGFFGLQKLYYPPLAQGKKLFNQL